MLPARAPLAQLVVLALLPSCLPEPLGAPTADEDAATSSPWSVRWQDGAGRDTPQEATPRRPRIRITGLATAVEDRPLLFVGPLDAAFSDDALRAPWSTETLARALRCEVRTTGDALVVTPSAPLAPGAEHVLLFPAFARDASGRPLGTPRTVPFRVMAQDGGAAWAGSFPPLGSAGVPTNLAGFDVAFDDVVSGLETLGLVDAADVPVPTVTVIVPCSELGFPEGSCATVRPLSGLAPRTKHRLVVPDAVRDRFGDPPIDAGGNLHVEFTTADVGAAPSPAALALPCGTDERAVFGGCLVVQDVRLLLRLRFGVPVRVRARFGARALVAMDSFGDVRLEWLGLAPAASATLALDVVALDGSTRASTTEITTESALAWVVLAEIRSDAIGPEPDAEYVELWNPTDTAVDVGGFRLSDDATREGDVLPAPMLLQPDARVLVVPDDFDAGGGPDARPPPGTPLVRIGASLGTSGLANGGEPLLLRDALGRRIAEVPAIAAEDPGVCIARLAAPGRDGARASYGTASHRACTPGTP